jgi:hypothetical protein
VKNALFAQEGESVRESVKKRTKERDKEREKKWKRVIER